MRLLTLLAATLLSATTIASAQAPTLPSAHDIISQAESKAATEHKAILLDFGASWCGNCHLFERFLTDPAIHPIMDKHFIMVTLITGEHPGDAKHANTPGGQQFEDSVGGKNTGWPFIVMLDATGKPLADSLRPVPNGKSNIGYPDSPAEVDWFMQMLQRSAPSLSPQETSTIHTWLTAHGHGA
jgi:thiol-disulfide isomerase/thioredoxin